MPVFNGAATLRPALDSLLAQTFDAFELVISDNASNDATAEICSEYANRDTRIRYVRQPRNIGAAANFTFVLREGRGEYFMWAAADDARSPDYLQVNLAFLETHGDYVASTSPVRFADGRPDANAMGDAPLDQGTPEARFLAFFELWHANGRFYSLFRRKPLAAVAASGAPQYLGSDWTIILGLLRSWKFHRANAGELVLGRGGLSNSTEVFRTQRSSLIEFVAPFWKLTWATMRLAKELPVGSRARLLARLALRNYTALVIQSRYGLRRRRDRP
jgi:glycosyltransferase involved in cell wall biosynthesis